MHEPEGLLAVAVIARHLRPDHEDQLSPIPRGLRHGRWQRSKPRQHPHQQHDQGTPGKNLLAHGAGPSSCGRGGRAGSLPRLSCSGARWCAAATPSSRSEQALSQRYAHGGTGVFHTTEGRCPPGVKRRSCWAGARGARRFPPRAMKCPPRVTSTPRRRRSSAPRRTVPRRVAMSLSAARGPMPGTRSSSSRDALESSTGKRSGWPTAQAVFGS